MNGIGFTMTVGGSDRQVPEEDVAEIEFDDLGRPVGSADSTTPPKPAVWLRNGDIVEGQLYDIDGGRPLRVTLKTSAGERQFSSADIRRIVLEAPSTTLGVIGGAGGGPLRAGIDVPANAAWIPSGVVVRRGEVLTLSATGQIQLSADAEDIAGPAGARSQRTAADAPLPEVPVGALIAKIGDGVPFPVGDAISQTMTAAGPLFFAVNDGRRADNAGAFRVTIERAPAR
jgi:hypothetical protein